MALEYRFEDPKLPHDLVNSNSNSIPSFPSYSRSYSERDAAKMPPKPKVPKSWSLTDAESKRKRRVVSYKVYTVETRAKSSLRDGIRWLKSKIVDMRYGW